MLSSAQHQPERQQHTNQPRSTSAAQHAHHNASAQRQPAAAMSYSYGPTVVYPSFNMGETFVGGAGYDAKENSSYAAFRAAAKEPFVVYQESSCGHSTATQQASGATGRVPLGERTNTSASTTSAAKRLNGAAPAPRKPAAQQQAAPPQQWKDIDAENQNNPLACSEYAQSIFEHLHDAELLHRPNPDYLAHVQRDMSPHMRRILVDWLVEVAQEYRLTSDTLHLTADLLNRYLSTAAVAREELQLAGIACMWVASKFEEIYAPTARNFCYITDNTYDTQQLVDMEARVLAELKYCVSVPTAKTFQRRYLQAAAADEQLHYLAAFLLELSLMDEQLLRHAPSRIAAGSVYLARSMLQREPWDATLAHYARAQEADVAPVAAELAFSHYAIAADGAFLAILDKYSSERLLCVSQMPPSLLAQRSSRWAAHAAAAAAAATTAGSTSGDDDNVGGDSPQAAAAAAAAGRHAHGSSELSSDMELV